ncbi:hypothetical protein [Amycolatopsis anabasis]|uniref:hypothetical protein n=1 Tax=Amycolatopsis anabasis TaxID=1840409 RepID=UPI00131CCA57|nr:hypothetical protein [Amycolatopsis anabasis]
MRIKGSRATRIMFAVLAGVGTALVAATPAHADAPAGPTIPPASTVAGSGGLVLDFPGFQGDPVRFSIAAHGQLTQAKGRFHVNHRRADGAPFGEFGGRVDCVATQGNVSVVTGIVETAELPGLPGVNVVGKRVGLTVQDNGPRGDRIGWSWAFAGFEHDALPCSGTVPFYPLSSGGLLVR